MSETAACLGLPVEFVQEGKTYRLAPVDFEIEGLFSLWLEGQALAAVRRHERALGHAGVALMMDGWRRECAAAEYDWDGLACWNARVSLPGRKYLAALQLSKGSGGLPLPDALDAVERAFDGEGSRRELEAKLAQANADPNRPRPYRVAPAAGG